MSRLISVLLSGFVALLFGFAPVVMASHEHETVAGKTETVKPLIKCSTCGVEFTSSAGLAEHLKAYPEHKAATVEPAKPLIKCSTCGVEFTSYAGVDEHIKINPEHKALIKCSTCGVEFTSGATMDEHMKAH